MVRSCFTACPFRNKGAISAPTLGQTVLEQQSASIKLRNLLEIQGHPKHHAGHSGLDDGVGAAPVFIIEIQVSVPSL
jgi:hypothetical protein